MARSSQLESSVLRRFLVGFPGTELPWELRGLLSRGLGGVAIFRRNWTSLESLGALTAETRRAARGSVLIGTDQEGGTLFSLPEPFTPWPAPALLGKLNRPELVEKMARAMATELRAAGINLNFAPMLDLHVNPKSPVTRVRSYGADPRRVGAYGRAFIRGMARRGMLTCAKHFPGHGDAAVDPHHDLPVFTGTFARLRVRELVPFRSVIRAGVPLVMTAHILLPHIDPQSPATLSHRVLHDMLRTDLRFKGVILADDLGMGAIARRLSAGEAAIQSLQAGSDMIALCHDWSLVGPAIDAVLQAHGRGQFDLREWRASEARIAHLLRRVSAISKSNSLDVIGCGPHRALAEKLAASKSKSVR